MQRVMLGMSGGVDSAVAALLLRDAGYEVCGVTLELLDANPEPATDARRVCDALGIAHKTLDCRDAFKRCVIRPFIATYRNARTPNPCIACNHNIKFPLLYEAACKYDYDAIATGHYARIAPPSSNDHGRVRLLRAKDLHKDQSYVLYSLSQELLSHTLLPLGDLSKTEVRNIALQQDLFVADKADSQDICFIPDGNYAAFLEQSDGFEAQAGDIVDKAGTVLGRHQGLHHYTIGQRKGLGIAARGIDTAPYYVLALDASSNRLIVGDKSDIASSTIQVIDVNWLSIDPPSAPLRGLVKTRYKQAPVAASIVNTVCEPSVIQGDTKASADACAKRDNLPSIEGSLPAAPSSCTIILDKPLDGIAPGQACVFYDESGCVVLGGGTILA